MDNLREELEQQFASAETQSGDVPSTNGAEEQTNGQPPAEVDEWSVAPKSFKQEYQDSFKTLPQNWRQYLIEREKQVEKGFSDLGNKNNSYKYIDDIFNGRQQRLAPNGITNSKEYFSLLAAIEDGLVKNPAKTIKDLSDAYGVDLNTQQQQPNEFMQQLKQLRNTVDQQQAYLNAQREQSAANEVNAFVGAKDETGNPKHPYFEDVKADMIQLLDKGVVSSLEDAYNRCIWTNEAVRNKLLAAKSKAELDAKVANAEKAKNAGFNPSSKATAPLKELSLHEELEQKFNELAN